EADVDLRDAFHRKFDQRGILDDVGEKSFALAVRCARIIPELLELCCHRDQPLANGIVQDELVLLSSTLSFLARLAERTQLVIPLGLERVSNKSVVRVDKHESALREVGVDLCTLNRAAAELISLFLPILDISSDVERQLYGGRSHPLDDKGPNGLVDRWPGDGLTVRLTESAMRSVTDIPGFLLPSPRAIGDAEMSAAPPAHRASFQQCCAFTRRR